MTRFILNGGYTRDENEENKLFFQELVKDIPNGGTMLIILFARKPEEYEWMFDFFKTAILKATEREEIDFELANKDDFIEQVKRADSMYFLGGDTGRLIEVMKGYPDFSKVISNKTVAGDSAGAYLLARYYHSSSINKVGLGLGLVPIKIICHHGSEKLPRKSGGIKQLKNLDEDLELVLLKDYEWRIFEI